MRAGQVLATLDTRDLRLRLLQAEATLQGNRAEALMAKQKLERMRPLRAENYVSDNDISNAERQLEIRNAQVRASEASLAQVRQQFGRTPPCARPLTAASPNGWWSRVRP